jgi:hypothetical protein
MSKGTEELTLIADTSVSLLQDMVMQHCDDDDGVYGTGALTINMEVFIHLVECGQAEWVGERYSRVGYIRFKEED